MQTILLSHEEAGQIAERLYKESIRQQVEKEENIGKMVLIDVESGDYEVDENGLEACKRLNERHQNITRLHGIRIGYNVAVSFGGDLMERIV